MVAKQRHFLLLVIPPWV